jgi:hypothetical protein
MRGKREASVERRFVSECKRLGLHQVKLQRLGCAGWPDRMVVGTNGVVVFVELKRPDGGKLSALQERKIQELQDLGHHAAVFSDADDAIKFVLHRVQIQVRSDVHTADSDDERMPSGMTDRT